MMEAVRKWHGELVALGNIPAVIVIYLPRLFVSMLVVSVAQLCRLCAWLIDETSDVIRQPKVNKRILIVTDYLPPQTHGIAIRFQQYIQHMRKEGHEVHVFATTQRPELETSFDHPRLPSVVNPWNVKNRMAYNPGVRLAWTLGARQWDVVHVVFPSLIGAFVIAVCGWRRIPVYCSHHVDLDFYAVRCVARVPRGGAREGWAHRSHRRGRLTRAPPSRAPLRATPAVRRGRPLPPAAARRYARFKPLRAFGLFSYDLLARWPATRGGTVNAAPTLKFLRAHMRCDPARERRIPTGVNVSTFTPHSAEHVAADRRTLIARLGSGVREDVKLWLMVQRLAPEKDTVLAFGALEAALARHSKAAGGSGADGAARNGKDGAPIHLVIAGDGPSMASLQAEAREKQLPVTFLGNTEHDLLPPLYRAAVCARACAVRARALGRDGRASAV